MEIQTSPQAFPWDSPEHFQARLLDQCWRERTDDQYLQERLARDRIGARHWPILSDQDLQTRRAPRADKGNTAVCHAGAPLSVHCGRCDCPVGFVPYTLSLMTKAEFTQKLSSGITKAREAGVDNSSARVALRIYRAEMLKDPASTLYLSDSLTPVKDLKILANLKRLDQNERDRILAFAHAVLAYEALKSAYDVHRMCDHQVTMMPTIKASDATRESFKDRAISAMQHEHEYERAEKLAIRILENLQLSQNIPPLEIIPNWQKSGCWIDVVPATCRIDDCLFDEISELATELVGKYGILQFRE
jgi:hypothetical protein